MKKLLPAVLILFIGSGLKAQGLADKIATDIRKLSGEYMTEFKNIKAALKSEDDYEAVFYSRLKINGSVDSSNLIHFVKLTPFWSFTADFGKEKITAAELDTIIRKISFSFDKLKAIASGEAGVNSYVPADKKGLAEKIKSFFITLYNGEKNPNDKTGRRLIFTMGQDDYYRNK